MRPLLLFDVDTFIDRVQVKKDRKVKVQKTSIEAHNSVKEHKAEIYRKIVLALEEMKVGGTAEEISTHMNCKPDIVWKRLPEMVEAQVLYNVGITRPTSTGRKSMVRQLVSLKK